MVLPDYSQTLDGGLWAEYQRIPAGGTPVAEIAPLPAMLRPASKWVTSWPRCRTPPATYLENQFGAFGCIPHGPAHGIRQTDRLMADLWPHRPAGAIPAKYAQERGRLLDALVDGHKYVNNLRAVLYGEADLVAGMVPSCSEIGIIPVICATGDRADAWRRS